MKIMQTCHAELDSASIESVSRRQTAARWIPAFAGMTAMLLYTSAFAQSKGPVTLSNDKPVEVSSDTLEVQQDKHQAIFLGNVIATQGTINMRADKMIVHYVNNDNAPASGAKSTNGSANGIQQIDASGHVVFTNATDIAKGDFATYNVQAQTLDLTGQVILNRDKNVLKGTQMHYDLATSRSTLTAGNSAVSDTGGQVSGNGRVHGLFVPEKKKNATSVEPKTGQ